MFKLNKDVRVPFEKQMKDGDSLDSLIREFNDFINEVDKDFFTVPYSSQLFSFSLFFSGYVIGYTDSILVMEAQNKVLN